MSCLDVRRKGVEPNRVRGGQVGSGIAARRAGLIGKCEELSWDGTVRAGEDTKRNGEAVWGTVPGGDGRVQLGPGTEQQ